MIWLSFVRVVSIVCTGLAAGVFLGHGRGVALAAPELGPSSFVQLQQIIHTHFVPMMPILLLAAAGASLAWAIMLRARWRGPEFWLVAIAAMSMVCVFVLTRIVNVPINEQLMTWSVQAPPVDLAALWQPWQDAHSIRTVLAMLAFILLAFSASLPVPSGQRPGQGPHAP